MGTQVANRPNMSALMAGLKTAAGQAPASGGSGYLRFAQGDWLMGKEKTDVSDMVVIMNTDELRTGFVCWTDHTKKQIAERKKQGKPANELIDEKMALAVHGGVDPDSLENHDPWEWQVQQEIAGRFIENETNFKFSTRSYGGLKAMRAMTEAIMERVVAEEEEFLYPVIRLETSSYFNDTWNTEVFEPVLTIIGWANVNGELEGELLEIEQEEDTPEERAAQVDAQDKPEGEAEDPPVRRRERRTR